MYCTVKTLILSLYIIVVFLYLCTSPGFVDVCCVNRDTDVTNKQSFYPPLPKNMMLTNYAIMLFDLKIFNTSQKKLRMKVAV